MVTFIVTTCLTGTFWSGEEKRVQEYITAILRLQECISDLPGVRIILVEGNGPRKTFLDDFGLEILYTHHNKLHISNYGLKEYLDIMSVIHHYQIPDDDDEFDIARSPVALIAIGAISCFGILALWLLYQLIF